MIIENRSFDEERALYGSSGVSLVNCRFEGPADGESAVKECSDISAEGCFFDLRYPLWHVKRLSISNSEMTGNCRAALWYSEDISIKSSKLCGIKALRECSGVIIRDCGIISPEFGWFCKDILMENCTAESEYFMMSSENLKFTDVKFKGKYSFQYIKNSVFENCAFDTKDAFWHAENVTIKNSTVKGEYLGWYSKGLTFENCVITGTQPLCLCKGLRLINCEMYEADFCFERSEVEAEITTPVISIRSPLSGVIHVPEVGEILADAGEVLAEIIVDGK